MKNKIDVDKRIASVDSYGNVTTKNQKRYKYRDNCTGCRKQGENTCPAQYPRC